MSIFRPGGLERDYELPKLVHHITTTEPYQFERIPINSILLITHTEKVVQKKRKGKILTQSPWPILLCPTCPCFGIILLIDPLLMVHCAEAAPHYSIAQSTQQADQQTNLTLDAMLSYITC